MALVYDDVGDESIHVIMKNDGYGHLVDIPSLLVSRVNGEKLKQTSNECPSLPALKIPFAIEKWETAEVTFWLDSNHVTKS